MDMFSNMNFVVRWLHVWAGIVWIGHLYFFNFVNIPFQGSLDDATKKLVNAKLILRALWWFRMGAMVTFIMGLILFVMNYMYTPGVGFGSSMAMRDANGITDRALWIMTGMLFGTIMWFNVWFVIWPAQKAIFSGSLPPDQVAATRARAGLFSKINTYLSGPMLFGMLAPNHFGPIKTVWTVIFFAIAVVAIWKSYFLSQKVGQSV